MFAQRGHSTLQCCNPLNTGGSAVKLLATFLAALKPFFKLVPVPTGPRHCASSSVRVRHVCPSVNESFCFSPHFSSTALVVVVPSCIPESGVPACTPHLETVLWAFPSHLDTCALSISLYWEE